MAQAMVLEAPVAAPAHPQGLLRVGGSAGATRKEGPRQQAHQAVGSVGVGGAVDVGVGDGGEGVIDGPIYDDI